MSATIKLPIDVTLKCDSCGSAAIKLPDNPTDDSVATCDTCKTEIGRWGDLKDAALETAADAGLAVAEKEWTKLIGGMKDIKINLKF